MTVPFSIPEGWLRCAKCRELYQLTKWWNDLATCSPKCSDALYEDEEEAYHV